MSVVDVIFRIRHNTAKVSRLKNFLSWKDVRKSVKDSNEKGEAEADAADFEEVSTASLDRLGYIYSFHSITNNRRPRGFISVYVSSICNAQQLRHQADIVRSCKTTVQPLSLQDLYSMA